MLSQFMILPYYWIPQEEFLHIFLEHEEISNKNTANQTLTNIQRSEKMKLQTF